MKKLIFLLPFMMFLSVAVVNAQSCGAGSASATKSCCSSKAAKAASADTNIEKRMADDGSVSYVRKETDTQGSVRFVSVQFDEASSTFVNVAPKALAAEDKAGMVKKSASCSSAEKKACCASGEKAAATKACCSSKTASAPQENQ